MNTKRTLLLVAAALALLSTPAAQAFYNPHTGRWLSRDPIEEEEQENHYGFVFNDPVSLVDAFGLYTFKELPSEDVDVSLFQGSAASLTVPNLSLEKDWVIGKKGEGAGCKCFVKEPRTYNSTVRMLLAKAGTSRGGVWVTSSFHSAAKKHEKKHVKMWKHYGDIFQQFEDWQKGQKESGEDCEQKLIERLTKCRDKAAAFFNSKTGAAHDGLDQAEWAGTAKGWIPSSWVGSKGWPWKTQADVFVLNGKWKQQLDPVKLDCD